MNIELRNKLIEIMKEKITVPDMSHDIGHTLRVLSNAEKIAEKENGDMYIVIAAALFHDIIVYPKNHPNKHNSQTESAQLADEILSSIPEYPQEKIEKVKTCILECSFSKGIIPESLESKIIQDADSLEASGVISIMRTFATTGAINRTFYNTSYPFCENREPEDLNYAIDLFYTRLLKIIDRVHTQTAKEIAERRTGYLYGFLEELRMEIDGE